jgi:hypothetical protein
LRTPTQRTEGGTGDGEGVGEIPAAPVAAGIAFGTGVSAAAICAAGKRRTNPQKTIKINKDRLKRCWFIKTFVQLASVMSVFRTPLIAAKNKEKPFPLYKMTDLWDPLAVL